jgi:UDP-glucose 4-epimerase
VFWGTGEETRDWIFSEDAADLVVAASKAQVPFTVINGAGGIRTTVKETLSLLSEALNSDTTMSFNNQVRDGDPRFYHADVSKSAALGWVPKYSLPEGISRYVSWLSSYGENTV